MECCPEPFVKEIHLGSCIIQHRGTSTSTFEERTLAGRLALKRLSVVGKTTLLLLLLLLGDAFVRNVGGGERPENTYDVAIRAPGTQRNTTTHKACYPIPATAFRGRTCRFCRLPAAARRQRGRGHHFLRPARRPWLRGCSRRHLHVLRLHHHGIWLLTCHAVLVIRHAAVSPLSLHQNRMQVSIASTSAGTLVGLPAPSRGSLRRGG